MKIMKNTVYFITLIVFLLAGYSRCQKAENPINKLLNDPFESEYHFNKPYTVTWDRGIFNYGNQSILSDGTHFLFDKTMQNLHIKLIFDGKFDFIFTFDFTLKNGDFVDFFIRKLPKEYFEVVLIHPISGEVILQKSYLLTEGFHKYEVNGYTQSVFMLVLDDKNLDVSNNPTIY